MAIKPNDGEMFLREVDEQVRKERLDLFFKRWGWALIAAIVLFLGAVGGWIWWQGRQQAAAAEQGEALLNALDALDDNDRDAARPTIDRLAGSDIAGYRAAALFARANAAVEAGNAAGAIAALREIAENEDFAEPYRDAALVRQTALEFDSLRPEMVIRRLGPLARPGQPWFGTAGEMVAVAHLKMNRPDLAGPIFARIARDETVPPSIRTRTVQMAGSLGIDAMGDAREGTPGEGAPAGNADEAAVKEKTE